ncbi:putative nucleoside-triphosphate phosphatase [Lupinus albus]|uniref:Putative nucleoside-triphosphate phosphatase n=1 Tax=Lupinus albus TaxID=3870 RepID=A0A6A4PC09_LUPAL|nr:putative nucleoside-triphosphate phosphatase [Lupinus albus]
MMSACINFSLIHPSSSSPPITLPKQPFPIRSLTLTNFRKLKQHSSNVLQRDFGTLSSSDSNDAVSSQIANLEVQFETDPPLVNGVVEDKGKSRVRKKKEEEDNNNIDDNRFKLRNGREVFEEKAYIVGVERKGDVQDFGIQESLSELEQLADTAGLRVVGSTYQKLASPNPKTYIGSGKVSEIKSAIHALDVETVIFDDELSAGQLRNLEKVFGGDVRVCDRTALILDIFNQRAATHEASLQATIN